MKCDVLVVGAGPYGFAVAGELTRCGLDVAAVGSPFATWHAHTLDGMRLRSDIRASSVWSADGRWRLERFLAERGLAPDSPLPVATFRRYLRAVAAAAPCPLLEDRVLRLSATAAGFRAELEAGGVVFAQAAVVATGMGAHRHLPEALARLPPERLFHSWDTAAIEPLTGRRVLVIGGGQSAGEAVESLAGRNRVTWAMRRPPLFFNQPLRAPSPIFEAMLGSSHLLFKLPPPLLRAISRRVFRTTLTPRLRTVYADPRVWRVLADADALDLSASNGGTIRAAGGEGYDAVVAATGYRPKVAGFDFLTPELAAALGPPDGPPTVDAQFESRLPGLFVIGGATEAVHGPAMRFLVGSRHAALRVAGRIERRWNRRAS